MTKEIRLPAPHPRVRPRLDAEGRRPGHPGTVVRIGEDLFEVVSAEKSGGAWVYRLEPWTGQETIRVCVDWGEEAAREFTAGLREDRIRERKRLAAGGDMSPPGSAGRPLRPQPKAPSGWSPSFRRDLPSGACCSHSSASD